MNQKRSRARKETSLDWENKTAVRPKEKAKPIESFSADRADVGLGTTQINPLHQFLRYCWQDSRWFNFNRGLFWGGVVSAISILSAVGGMALTKIDVVEQQISARLPQTPTATTSNQYPALTEPLQILLVEAELDDDALAGFSQTAAGKSKTVLLLEIEPESNSARAIFIPLDSSTYISGVGWGTIRDAYQIGGMKLLSEAISQLPYDISVDRYLRTTSKIFQQLIDSGKIEIDRCEPRIEDCFDRLERVARQETTFRTIRQRLNIPSYLASFTTAIERVESQLDTNLSPDEIMSVANFIKELEPDRIKVDLLPGYTSGVSIQKSTPTSSVVERAKSNINSSLIKSSRHPFKNNSVAVQNTTDDPELGRRIVAYLREQNFADVYLVKHVPLKLTETRIVTNYARVETANYLKNVLGFGNLKPESDSESEIVLQLGKDAFYLPIGYRSDRQKLNQ